LTNRFQPIEKLVPLPEPPGRPADVGTAHPRRLPAMYLDLLPQPLSAYDDNPVLNEAGAAFLLGGRLGVR
jgi:hypothetical protein